MTFFHLSTVWKVSVFGVFLVRIFPHSEPSQISKMESFCENSQRLKRFWIRLRQAAVLPKSDYTLIILLTSSVCVDFCCHSWFMAGKCEHYQVVPKYSCNLVKKLQGLVLFKWTYKTNQNLNNENFTDTDLFSQSQFSIITVN